MTRIKSSPESIGSNSCSVKLIRWSVTRFYEGECVCQFLVLASADDLFTCGKLYVRIFSERVAVPICFFRASRRALSFFSRSISKSLARSTLSAFALFYTNRCLLSSLCSHTASSCKLSIYLVLWSFVLHRHSQAGGYMVNSDCTVCSIYMLATCTGRSIYIYPEVRISDLHFNLWGWKSITFNLTMH